VTPQVVSPPPDQVVAEPAPDPTPLKPDNAKRRRRAKAAAAESSSAEPVASDAPAAAAAVAPPVSAFTKPPAKGVERVFVTARGVPMVAMPDEIRSIARLQRGDEIEIIGSHESHLNVRTPNGVTGWIPRGSVSTTRPRIVNLSRPAPH
jgi:hypothetical protein